MRVVNTCIDESYFVNSCNTDQGIPEVVKCTKEFSEAPESLGSMGLRLERYWKVEVSAVHMSDVQDRLKLSIEFWRGVLKAPPPIIDCREWLPLAT